MHEIGSRDQLLNHVRDYVALKVSERPELVAAFLVGSVARADPLWANTTDFNVIFVDPDPPLNLEPCLLWNESLLIDVQYFRPEDYENRPILKRDAMRGQSLYDAIPLHDTKSFFALLQAYVRGQFDTAENVVARATDAFRRAHAHYDEISDLRNVPVPIPVDPNDIKHLYDVIDWAATVVLMLAYKPRYGRRQVLCFGEALAQMGQSNILELAEQSMGFGAISDDVIDEMRKQWLEIFRAAGKFHKGHWGDDKCVHPLKEQYYMDGFEKLAAVGHASASLFLMEYTVAAAFDHILTHAPAEAAVPYVRQYTRWMDMSGKGSAKHFSDCLVQLSELLHRVEYLIYEFAKDNGIVYELTMDR